MGSRNVIIFGVGVMLLMMIYVSFFAASSSTAPHDNDRALRSATAKMQLVLVERVVTLMQNGLMDETVSSYENVLNITRAADAVRWMESDDDSLSSAQDVAKELFGRALRNALLDEEDNFVPRQTFLITHALILALKGLRFAYKLKGELGRKILAASLDSKEPLNHFVYSALEVIADEPALLLNDKEMVKFFVDNRARFSVFQLRQMSNILTHVVEDKDQGEIFMNWWCDDIEARLQLSEIDFENPSLAMMEKLIGAFSSSSSFVSNPNPKFLALLERIVAHGESFPMTRQSVYGQMGCYSLNLAATKALLTFKVPRECVK